MRRWLVASALLAAASSITQVAGKERALPKQQVQPTATLRASRLTERSLAGGSMRSASTGHRISARRT